MTFASAAQFHLYLTWVNAHFAYCLNSVFNVKATSAFNQDKARRAFSVIVKADGSLAALVETVPANEWMDGD